MNAGDKITLALAAGTALTLTVPSGAAGTLTRLSDQPGGGDPSPPAVLNGADVTVGPFASPRRYMITCSAGAIAYDEAAAAASGGGGTLPSGVVTAGGGDGPVAVTALTIDDFAPDPSAISTGASPITLPLGPRLYRVTTGGTAGSESIILPMPELPLDDFANDQLIGLRISISLGAQTGPSDVVVITADGGAFTVVAPLGIGLPQIDSVSLSYVGAAVSFVWGHDGWLLDTAATDSNFDVAIAAGQQTGIVGQTNPDGSGSGLNIQGAPAFGTGNAGDISLVPGLAQGSGANGNLRLIRIPTADPHDENVVWSNAGVLTLSAG